MTQTCQSRVTRLHDRIVCVVFSNASRINEQSLCDPLEMRCQLVVLDFRAVRRKALSQLLDCLTQVYRHFWLVGQRGYERLDEECGLMFVAGHHVGVVRADLEDDPGDGLAHLNGRILEHVEQLCHARRQDVGEGSLIGAVSYSAQGHEGGVPFLPLVVHDVSLDECDDGIQSQILQQQTDFDEAAARGEVDTPLFFSIILVIDLYVADALKEQLDQEVFVGAHKVVDLAMLLKTCDLHLCYCRPEFNALRTDLRLIILGDVARHLAQFFNVVAHHVVFLTSDLNKALHGRFSDYHVRRLQSFVDNFRHDEVALSLILEVCGCVWNAVEQGFDCQTTCVSVDFIFADVLGESKHDVVLKLLRKVLRAELLADVANGCEGCQSDLLVFVFSVRAQIRNQFSPFAPRDLRLSDRCNQTCDLVADKGRIGR